MSLSQVPATMALMPPHWQPWADPAISEDPCPGSPIKDTSEQETLSQPLNNKTITEYRLLGRPDQRFVLLGGDEAQM